MCNEYSTWTKLSSPTSTTLQESIYLPTRYDWDKLGQYQSRMAVLKKQVHYPIAHICFLSFYLRYLLMLLVV
jgi:hypothetical protein